MIAVVVLAAKKKEGCLPVATRLERELASADSTADVISVARTLTAAVEGGACAKPGPQAAAKLQRLGAALQQRALSDSAGMRASDQAGVERAAEQAGGHGAAHRQRASSGEAPKRASAVAKFTKLKVKVGVGTRGEQASLQLKLPNQPTAAIATPAQLHKHVAHAWDVVVAPNQAGLTDAKAPAPSTELSAGEAWHHYQAAQQGVVDSARLCAARAAQPTSPLRSSARPRV